MASGELAEIRQAIESAGPASALDQLIERLRGEGAYERMFDALLMRARLELGLSVCAPTGFQGVPEAQRPALEEAYVNAARSTGQALLDAGNLPRAWIYFRTIQEPQPIARALEAIDPASADYEELNELIEIALHDGANRIAGLRLLLASHGTCNTVTMTDQILPMLTPDERRQAAAMLVRDVHGDLRSNLARVVADRDGGEHADDSIHELIAKRDWLFEQTGYHIDVSHLHATVRFARGLKRNDPELAMAMELAEYGDRLDPQFHFAADPPFDEYYAAHQAFLKALGDIDREASLDYFRNRLQSETDERDRQITAYVLVDLLTCCGMREAAAEVAAEHLGDLEEPNGFSFSALCGETKRFDLLQSVAEEKDDPIRFAAALIEQRRANS